MLFLPNFFRYDCLQSIFVSFRYKANTQSMDNLVAGDFGHFGTAKLSLVKRWVYVFFFFFWNVPSRVPHPLENKQYGSIKNLLLSVPNVYLSERFISKYASFSTYGDFYGVLIRVEEEEQIKHDWGLQKVQCFGIQDVIRYTNDISCGPRCYITHISHLAHDSITSGHFRHEKTLACLRNHHWEKKNVWTCMSTLGMPDFST